MPTPNIGLTQPVSGTTPWDGIVNNNSTIIDNCFGGAQVIPAIAPTNIKPNNVATILAGVAALVAKADLTAQNNNFGNTLLYTVPAGGAGLYRAVMYLVVTTAAGTTSTLPNGDIGWTDNDTGVAASGQVTGSSTGNTVGTTNSGSTTAGPDSQSIIFNAKAGTAINYFTTNYASNPANAMQYAVHVKLEYLGL